MQCECFLYIPFVNVFLVLIFSRLFSTYILGTFLAAVPLINDTASRHDSMSDCDASGR